MSTNSITRATRIRGFFGAAFDWPKPSKAVILFIQQTPFLWVHGIAQIGSIHKQINGVFEGKRSERDFKKIKAAIPQLFKNASQVTFLTGAGISAQSGIPTFRGPEGYWRIGSKNYQPQEIATFAMFHKMPREVWKWYLFRRGVCRKAAPNSGHLALAKLERILGERFHLVTQNVDGLHLQGGNSLSKTFQIHGNIDYMRCSAACTEQIFSIPDDMPTISRGETLPASAWQLLRCPQCGEITRPHVLLWDESYNEEHYHFQSSLALAQKTDLLLIVGTAGATNLPNQIASLVAASGGTIIDINIQRNLFSEIASKTQQGFFWESSSSEALPQILALLESG